MPPSPAECGFTFACPACGARLETAGPEALACPRDQTVYTRQEGIWRFLAPGRRAALEQFIREYETVRRAEGRGSDDPAYYRALPFHDLSGRFRSDWRIRARSYRVLEKHVLGPLEAQGRPLKLLDLGAGNGWLSYRLAQRGHTVAAVDLSVNSSDGLGAYIHYDAPFTPVQAEFDCLPFTEGQADAAIFNASFHYATDYARTLRESLRVLHPEGQLAILDSPVYRNPDSGAQMVREREEHFCKTYGFPANALSSENYLSYARLERLAGELGLSWQMIAPFYGLRWALRPWKARLLGQREPAQFLLLTGRPLR